MVADIWSSRKNRIVPKTEGGIINNINHQLTFEERLGSHGGLNKKGREVFRETKKELRVRFFQAKIQMFKFLSPFLRF